MKLTARVAAIVATAMLVGAGFGTAYGHGDEHDTA